MRRHHASEAWGASCPCDECSWEACEECEDEDGGTSSASAASSSSSAMMLRLRGSGNASSSQFNRWDALFQALTRPADLRAYLQSTDGQLRMQIDLLTDLQPAEVRLAG